MIQTSFLIPLKDQFTQDLHPYTKFEELEKDLLLMFGGWTFTGIVRGCWKDPDTNEEIYERSRKPQGFPSIAGMLFKLSLLGLLVSGKI